MAKYVLLLLALSSCFHFKPPRCRVQGCKVRMIHQHSGQAFRGQPWWKRNQNPKVGQDYKPVPAPVYAK